MPPRPRASASLVPNTHRPPVPAGGPPRNRPTRLSLRTLALLFVASVPLEAIAQDATAGLEFELRLDGSFLDGSGNDFDGVAAGDPAFGDGQVGSAAEFDAVDDTVTFPTFDDALLGADDFTVTFWLQLTVAQGRASILSKREICNNGVFLDVRIDGFDRISAAFGTGVGPALLTEALLPAGWNHIALVREQSEVYLYRNGARVDTDSSPVPFTLENDIPLGISTSPCVGEDGTQLLGAALDELRIFSRALGSDDIDFVGQGGLFTDGFESGDTARWSQTVPPPSRVDTDHD